MARKKISQCDARQYKRELDALKAASRSDRSTWGGVYLATFAPTSEICAALNTAQALGHPLACHLRDNRLIVYGVR